MLKETLISIYRVTFLVIFSAFMISSSGALDLESIQGVWLFNEGDGNEALDSSGKEHNGTINNGEWVDGKFGDALEFMGGGKVEVLHADGFTTPTFTLMAWIMIDQPNATWQLIVGKDGWPDRNYGMFVAKDTGVIHFAFCAPGQQDVGNFNAKTVVADGAWHHIAITYDMKMRRAYVDGNLDAENGSAAEPSESVVPVEIGRNITGIIDEVLIADQAFSEDEIKQAMELGLEVFIGGGEAVSASGKLTTAWGSIKM